MKTKYMDLPNGVYYQRAEDSIFILSDRYNQEFVNIKTLKTFNAIIYTYEAKHLKYKKIRLVKSKNIIRLGDL